MRPDESWSRSRVTAGIVLVTAGCWLIAAILGLTEWAAAFGGFVPASLADPGGGLAAPFWLTPLTATLVHANLIHVAFNLLIMIFCGRKVEKVLGPASLAILYLLGAYAAAGAQYLVTPGSLTPMIGASGAISAVLGAHAMLFGRNRVSVVTGRLAVLINALWLMAAWIALQLLVGLAAAEGDFPFSGSGMAIAFAAHIGGFVIGVGLANPLLLFRYRKA